MPAKYMMTWDHQNRRWRELHGGRRYVVSCRQLGAPENKEGSYLKANDWWQAKLAEIAGQAPAHPHAAYLGRVEKMIAWSQRHDPDNVEGLRRSLECVQEDTAGAVQWDVAGDASRAVWEDRLRRDRADPVPEDRTVGGQVKRWFSAQEARVLAGEISAARHNNHRICLGHFRDFVGASIPVTQITEETWTAYHRF